MSERDILIYRIDTLATRAVFPKIYDGFVEIDELAKGEDALLNVLKTLVLTALNDKVISTASAEKISEYEEHLYLSATGLTLDQRRQQVLDYLNRSRVFNKEALQALIDELAGSETATFTIDPIGLILGLNVVNDGDHGALLGVTIANAIRPRVPQNLDMFVRVDAGIDMDMVHNYAHFGAMAVSLGKVAYHAQAAPGPIYIGVTTSCPAGTTVLYSPYFWSYAFSSASSDNWWHPSYYQNATPPIEDNSLYPVGGTRYEEVVLTDGAGGTYTPYTFRLAQYSSKPEFYMDSSYSSQNSSRNGVIIKFGSDLPAQSFNLPADMYSISGTTITWDMSHPLMVLLQGKQCI